MTIAAVGTISGTPAPTRAALLRSVLSAELEPGITVLDAATSSLVPVHERLALGIDAVRMALLLNSAGLRYYSGNETTPGAVVLRDEPKFRAKFPDLALAIPALLSVNGVRLNGQPSEPSPISLAAAR